MSIDAYARGVPDPTRRRPREDADGSPIGRPYDRSSDALILATALDLIADRPYDRVTLDDVARLTGKAKTTLYRRWATKDDLVVAAVLAVGRPPESVRLPDRGSLRDDLLAVVDSPWLGGPERRLVILAGLASAARSSERVGDVVRSEITEPYVDVYRRLLDRAIERGEVPPEIEARVPVLAQVVPAMSTHRLGAGDTPADRAFFVAVIDDVLLAALRGRAATTALDDLR